MSSIFSTQKRQTFFRRKYCFFWVATALSPPVGRCPALPGLPLDSAISILLAYSAGAGSPSICCATDGWAGAAPPWLCGALACHGPFALFQALQRFIDTDGQKLD